MPLMHGKGKKPFEHNIKEELHAGKPKDQSLAIAYNIRRHAKKAKGGEMGYAKGGEVNESLHPDHEPSDSLATKDIDHLSLDKHDQSYDFLDHPAEPKDHIEPADVNMGRSAGLEFADRIKRAVNMAMGGRVDEHEGQDHSEEADRRLAMNDTYPPGPAESDTQAQDEGFGDAPMDNEEMPEDQRKSRRMSMALESVRRRHMGQED